MFYVSKFDKFMFEHQAVTLDYALMMAERLSRLLEPDTNVFPRMMVWEKAKVGVVVRAVAYRGSARMYEKCICDDNYGEIKCKNCNDFGWKESGKDRG